MTEKKVDTSLAKEVLTKALAAAGDNIHPSAHRLLHEAFPERTILETGNSYFRPWYSTPLWKIRGASGPDLYGQFDSDWNVKHKIIQSGIYSGWLEVEWNDHEILILAIGVQGGHCRSIRWYVVGENSETVEGFFKTVCELHSTVKNEVLVFQEGHWYPDRDLFKSIQGTTLQELVLHGELKKQITEDLQIFLDQKETFDQYRLPWKRGVVFLGPPGNGKTHMIKALVNHFKLPCLYVKSFSGQYVSSHQCVSNVFARARDSAPCLLILEDLDTLLDEENRSFFLNEMDGFASNHGIITIASCNFPEKLDAAILERPSRFDRKYHFELPPKEDRRRYIEMFMQRFDEKVHLDSEGLDAAAEYTEGYSYAYLKELYVSSVIRWVSAEKHRPVTEIIKEQAEELREQMMTAMTTPPNAAQSRGRRHPYMPSFMVDEDDD